MSRENAAPGSGAETELVAGNALRNAINKKAKQLARRLKANEEFRATPKAIRRAIIKAALSETGRLRQPLAEQISVAREVLAEPEDGLGASISASSDTIRRDIEKISAELGLTEASAGNKTRPKAAGRATRPAATRSGQTTPVASEPTTRDGDRTAQSLVADQDDMFGGSR